MVAVFTEVRRVLATDGTCWLNLGDSYYSGRGNPGPNADDDRQPARRGWIRPVDKPSQPWASPKNMLGIPWRVAFALQESGWTLRNDVIWVKPNATPESALDRLSTKHEHLFLLTKGKRYWFDLDPIREERIGGSPLRPSAGRHADAPGLGQRFGVNPLSMKHTGTYLTDGKNPGDVWTIGPTPFAEAHFATMPVALAERCIQAGCRPGGTVLDPYSGSGTTGLAATKHGRRYVGIDLNREYLDMSLRTRLAQTALIEGAS